jgi:hypothetical protein
MKNQYTPISIPIGRYANNGQQIDPVSSFKGHSNLRDMWKLKIMNAQ